MTLLPINPTPPGDRLTSFAREEAALLSLLSRHQLDEARALAEDLTRRFPEQGIGWKIWGALAWMQARTPAALEAMRRAASLLPNDAEAHSNLGSALSALERFDEAQGPLSRAVAIDPTAPGALYRLGMFHELSGDYDQAQAVLRKAVACQSGPLTADHAHCCSYFLFIASHDAGATLASWSADHRRVGRRLDSARALRPQTARSADPERPLRVGLISADLREHPVGRFLLPIARCLSGGDTLELHAYYHFPTEDATTRALRSCCKGWHSIGDVPDDALAARIAADRIDVLIDLAGHTALNRLAVFARRPAPVQASWLGYPGTTGMRSVDYYIADARWLPPGAFEHAFTEQLVYLPVRWAYAAPDSAPVVGALPMLASGRVTFGSFHRVAKITEATLDLWCELLRQVPTAVLLLVGIDSAQSRAKLVRRFGARGVAEHRLTLAGRTDLGAYFALHAEVDIALDTQPYAGGTTTMDALWMGVPTLTLAGPTPPARAGAGILGAVGLDDFVAVDAADFVRRGIHWAAHPAELGELRAGLRERVRESPFGRPEVFAAHLESACRQMWRRWCAGKKPRTFETTRGGGGSGLP
jgi:predicted O-linked N-acetylglucosamine transferase (SPINDLY family)